MSYAAKVSRQTDSLIGIVFEERNIPSPNLSICFRIRDRSTFFKLNSEPFLAVAVLLLPLPLSLRSVCAAHGHRSFVSISISGVLLDLAEAWPFLTHSPPESEEERDKVFLVQFTLRTLSISISLS